jgi:glycosyltransferase involved in cell wall biosynthesis
MTAAPPPEGSRARADPRGLAVDIVIDNYNYGRFLRAAIESALEQSHPRVNVLVVDDGSTDDSRAILSEYGGAVTAVLKENGGQASALNAGFARSTGDVAIFLDSDDMLRPHAAALAAASFAADPRVAKVQYRLEVIDGEGRPTGDVRRAELTFPFDLVWLRTGAVAYRSELLHRILPMPEREFAACADWYLVHLTPLLGHVVSLDDVAACYRVHGANSYEPQAPTLELEHVRRTITFAAVTTRALERLADDLGLERPYSRTLSVADIANRLVSLKFAPKAHPVATDRRWRLVCDGILAAGRRFDVAWPMKLLFAAWFALFAAAPSPVARRLAEAFLFPERRAGFNRLLGLFHRSQRKSGVRLE